MTAGYKQFCPVAMASEILCTKWTIVLLRELVEGSTKFGDLRKGMPRMSPALPSQRLKELEASGVIDRIKSSTKRGAYEYVLTEAGRDLRSVIEAIGVWGQRWVDADLTLENLDPTLLMWDMRRNLNVDPLPERQSVIKFHYTDLSEAQQNWWMIAEETGSIDLCSIDPGFEVDLYVTTTLRPMTSIWMGFTTVRQELEQGTLSLDGSRTIAEKMQNWLGLSPFAAEKKRL
ncbi:transcriptional regulator [Sulfitobacter sp. SK012]|uniref:winged helix-turn-helix transcriptional regulator n=1 Tax=Sulfitobacter sp. SK012 TaxID=1389005 RepID=UPI000E0A143F|nr:helix-turn-helix domain-containing protein [Sulfitobacter sp. SK012]AXI46318.1 transcriptional regulator [Sulfitobacter sp. SK012]